LPYQVEEKSFADAEELESYLNSMHETGARLKSMSPIASTQIPQEEIVTRWWFIWWLEDKTRF
jgi:hypothetical protein